ncbi:MAG: 4Fe-4S dicluster domain-containing protein [Sedimentisphaerales bacterium]|nr:4Fe-4S dicluster domain-containing protein [Sedimentisphaerales bacterium]
MGLISFSKVDHDFEGGIYLSPIGEEPALDAIETVDIYEGDLFLPLTAGSTSMQMIVDIGQTVEKNTPVARSDTGHCVYVPCVGTLAETTTVWVDGQPDQPAVRFKHGSEQACVEAITAQALPEPILPAKIVQDEAQRLAVLHLLERSGLTVDGGELLVSRLQRLQRQGNIKMVVANATPLEPALNTPLAILESMPAEVFAGLAIIKAWLGAEEAVVAYPHHFDINHEAAEHWQVRCLPVSEKYPQARPESVLRTLQKQRHLPPGRQTDIPAVVFDIQLLLQVERIIMTGALPVDRIVTICGDGVAKPGHFLVPVGLPLNYLLKQALIRDDAECVIAGGILCGMALDPEKSVIGPGSQYITVIHRLPRSAAQECIRCGWCIDDCPAGIDPARLWQLSREKKTAQAAQIGLDRCIECGICSYICPAHLPLMQKIIKMKQELTEKSG